MRRSPRRYSTVEEHFWAFVKRGAPDQCWIWEGHINGAGYGQFTHNNKMMSAHRVSHELFVGSITKRNVCHTCDVRACVNPAHLFQATQSENMLDCVAKERISPLIMRNIERGQFTRMDKELKRRAQLIRLRERIIRVVGPMEISDEALMRFYENPLNLDPRKRDRFGHFITEEGEEHQMRPRDQFGQFI